MKILLNKVFLKFIVSFLVTLLFPVSIIIVVFNSYFVNLYMTNILQQNQLNLDMYQVKIDSYIRNCSAIAVQIPSMDGFSSQQLSCFKTNYEKITKILKAYQITQDFCSEVKFYSFYNPDTIYSAGGTINPAYFCKYGENSISLMKLLEGKTKSFWIRTTMESSENGRQELLQYIVPVVGENTDFILFDINERIFDDISANKFTINEIYCDGALIHSTNSNPEINLEDMQVIINDPQVTGMEYRRYIPTDVLMGKVKSMQHAFIYIMLAIVLIGGVLVYLIAITRYKPIKRLTNLAKDVCPDIPNSIGEFEFIGFAINHIGIKNEEYILKDKLKKLFYTIIYRQYTDSGTIAKQCKRAGIFGDGKKWRAAILTIGGVLFAENASIERICTDVLESIYEIYFLDYSARNYFIVILGCETDSLLLLKNKLAAIADSISIRFDTNASFFVGGGYGAIEELAKSYSEAVLASGDKLRDEVNFYRPTLTTENRLTIYPKIELEALHSSIIESDLERIVFFINVLTEAVVANNYSNFMRSSICYDIINTFLKSAEELNLSNDLREEMYRIEYQAQPSCTINDYFSMIREFEKLFLETLSKTEEREVVQENEEIKEFIDTYPDIGQLCVGFVAEHFGVSISNLSHRFKSQTGMNISTYIVARRIEYTKKLLTETDLNLSEIAEKLSYCHTNSLIRVFKSMVGMTPGEYRRLFTPRK